MALTKVDMAECLFDELGLNKREAGSSWTICSRSCAFPWSPANR